MPPAPGTSAAERVVSHGVVRALAAIRRGGQCRGVGPGELGCLGQQPAGRAEHTLRERRGGANPDGPDGQARAVGARGAVTGGHRHAFDVTFLCDRLCGRYEPAASVSGSARWCH
ncbi:hypothetical protein C1I97_14135 [Streptomyces sp. NTH33]|nr:hypothetical protein C1I97_14135 [Streptomyces sp. NTH33]